MSSKLLLVFMVMTIRGAESHDPRVSLVMIKSETVVIKSDDQR